MAAYSKNSFADLPRSIRLSGSSPSPSETLDGERAGRLRKMAMVAVGLLCACAVIAAARGAPGKTRYDQSQKGELNIHAQLDNVVFVVIPSAKLNLMDLTDGKHDGEKAGFWQLLHKLHKEDMDRLGAGAGEKDDPATPVSATDLQNDIKTEMEVPVITSQALILNHGDKNEEKEEVAAVVEEKKQETSEKAKDTPTPVSNEPILAKEPSSTGDAVQDSLFTLSIPEHLKDDMEAALAEAAAMGLVKTEDSEPAKEQLPQTELNTESNHGLKEPIQSVEVPKKENSLPPKTEVTSSEDQSAEVTSSESASTVKESSKEDKSGESASLESSESGEQPMKELITSFGDKKEKPQSPIVTEKQTQDESSNVAPKKTTQPTNVRRDKVIRYEADKKRAPALGDLLAPPRQSKELQEQQRLADLCAPGVWDPEAKICILIGET